MNVLAQLARMLRQSVDAMIHPNVRTFNYYGARASDSETLLYATVGATLVGLLNQLIFGGFDLIGLAYSIVNQLFAFYIFSGIAYLVGRQFGGMGGFQTVASTFVLFYVPIVVLSAALIAALFLLRITLLPPLLVWLVQLIVLGFYAYQAVQAALYLRRPRDAALTVLIALAGLLLIQLLSNRSIL
jgi:hypothetical protein